jgi:hypothetical protein
MNIKYTENKLQHFLLTYRVSKIPKLAVGQKEDLMHSNFQMDISLPWIDAAFT